LMLRRADVALMRETRVDDALLRSAECGARSRAPAIPATITCRSTLVARRQPARAVS
jgi:hypothetical protein